MSAGSNLVQSIWRLTWPMVLFNLLEWTVGLADLWMVRPLGPQATAAIGVNRQVTFIVEALAVTISTGVITLASQAVGSGSAGLVNRIIGQSFRLLLLASLPIAVMGFLLSGKLLVWLQASDGTIALGRPYLEVYFGGVVFLWGNSICTAIFRSQGDVWTPLKLALGVNLCNILLNYLFIYGAGPLPPYEVMGAAMGTVSARAAGTLVLVAILWKRLKSIEAVREASQVDRRGFDWGLIRQMVKIGAPMAAANILRHGSRLVFIAIAGATSLGMSFQAALGVGMQIRLLCILPALAFQIATATLVGQAIGRGDLAEARSIGNRSQQMLAVLMLVVVAMIIVLAHPLANLLIDDREIAHLGARVLRWFAVAQWFSAMSICTQGALMGAGDTAPALRYTVASEWMIMLPAALLLQITATRLPDSMLAIWTLAPMISFILMQRRFRIGPAFRQ